MLRKYRTLIITVSAVVFAVAVIIGVGLYKLGPILPPWEKEKVEQAYFEDILSSDEKKLSKMPLIWYDENDYIEEKNVWRYVGKYGDCYAFLQIGYGLLWAGDMPDPPYPISSLTRKVMYPQIASVYLYHTKKDVIIDQREVRLETLENIVYYAGKGEGNLNEWITDAQLERLTQDIEKMAKQG